MPGRRTRRDQRGPVEQPVLLAAPEEKEELGNDRACNEQAGNDEGGRSRSWSSEAANRTREDRALRDKPATGAAVRRRSRRRASTRDRSAARKAAAEVAATASAPSGLTPGSSGLTPAPSRHTRKRPGPKWGNLVALFLVLVLSSVAAYNQGLLDRPIAWVMGTEVAGPDETGSTGGTGSDPSGTEGTQGEPGQPGGSGQPGGPSQPGDPNQPGQAGDPGGEPGKSGHSGEPLGSLAPMEMALSARALYLTMDTAGTPSRMASIMKYMRAHKGLNSFVIDIKDNNGRVPAKPPEHIPARAGSYSHLPGLIQILADLDYYMIARVVAFQDPYRAQEEPERAIRRADGSLWRDRDGRLWLNPYDEKNWEFVRDVALWAVDMGFHEIQLDYVRFPDSARGLEGSGNVLMPGSENYETRGDCIAAFLDYMSEALEGKAYLGADIFGFATIAADDMGIGHKWEQLADSVDFMCPMVYPSHYYNAGIYGFEVPEAHPYEVVYKAMAEALERSEGLRSKTRPWLQDFSMRIKYGSEEVSGQIRGTFEHGIETYMLWNPANNYTDGVEYVPEVEVAAEISGTE
jgi:hypothetical protein